MVGKRVFSHHFFLLGKLGVTVQASAEWLMNTISTLMNVNTSGKYFPLVFKYEWNLYGKWNVKIVVFYLITIKHEWND